MLVQVIEGRTSDAEGLARQFQRWVDDVRPGAVGFLGSTVGIAEDGTAFAFARFADAAAARANAARPEQGAWWEETSKYFDAPPTFRDSEDVTTLFDGGSDRARFVQVMEGRVTDRSRAEASETPELEARLRAARPDLLGGLRVWFDGGTYAEVAYFTSEADARAGEQGAAFAELAAGTARGEVWGDMTFTDLRSPLLVGP